MARILIVGCGCRGRQLGANLASDGYLVRGTSRRHSQLAEIEDSGIEPVQVNTVSLSEIVPQLDGVAVVVWLMGSAVGERSEISRLHGELLERLLRFIVDTQVRGFAYESAGNIERVLLSEGEALVRKAEREWLMPIAFIDGEPTDYKNWLCQASDAVESLL